MDKKTLLNCPFCNGTATYIQDMRLKEKNENFPKWYIKCKNCGVETPIATIQQVQKIWNTRVTI